MRQRLALVMMIQVLLIGAPASGARAEEMVDTREPVQRTDAEKAFILDQMRLFLTALMEIEEALGANDMDTLARVAATRGRKANVSLPRPATLAAKETEAWRMMIGSVRSGFDAIAEKASAHAPATDINRTLADTMRNCVACHQGYRISVEAR